MHRSLESGYVCSACNHRLNSRYALMKYDIVIIGAGPAGLSFACSLAGSGLKILMVDKSTIDELRSPVVDGRDIALTHYSIRLLKELGVWSRIPAQSIAPIRQAKVLDGDSDYSLNFNIHSLAVNALGYLVPNHEIRRALFEEVEAQDDVRIIANTAVDGISTSVNHASVRFSNGQTVETGLVVAADSRFSTTRRMMGIAASMQDFGRVAIVFRMQHELSHNATAFECFQYDGRTMAVFPLSERQSSIVITVTPDIAEQILGMSEARFNADVTRRFKNRVGKMTLTGKRYPYPLVAVYADRFVATRFALIGDAAVGMHPVTAHGYNLGLWGQNALAGEIRAARAEGRDIGAFAVLDRYQSRHRRVTRPLYLGTNGIVSLFTNDALPARLFRKLTLRISNNLPPLKGVITSQLTEAGVFRNAAPPFLR